MRVPRQNRVGLAVALCAAAVGAAALIAPFAGASDEGVPSQTGTERPGEEYDFVHVDDMADHDCYSVTRTGEDDAPEAVTGTACEIPEDGMFCGDGEEAATEVASSVTVEVSTEGVVCYVDGVDTES
ncbi:hypothetical protein [Actinoalloteichus spitiensis]|uniref:hypothetical protein n=1 Tax=Actinoalloteichus spitiensis TaxID=252394 RepID=UPI0012F66A59|nr:hypothetical protein [Actinoalloteichus spitiensis]